MNDAVRGRLLEAADMVERVGLHKGDWWPGANEAGGHVGSYRDGAPLSVTGALMLRLTHAEVTNALVWLGKQIDESNIQRWTDRPEVSASEVVTTIRNVAS